MGSIDGQRFTHGSLFSAICVNEKVCPAEPEATAFVQIVINLYNFSNANIRP
ncbi:hypothetical protein L7Q78_08380 [Achromobacter xylosoxidans]|jgi:hypothetical protein|nr:hypothetical protein [Achromobacter xylosoxidans]